MVRARIASIGTPSLNLLPMLAVKGSISHFGSLSFIDQPTYGVAFALPFTSFYAREIEPILSILKKLFWNN